MNTQAEQLHMPPADSEAERGVLGAMLLRNEAIDLVELQPEDFHDVRHEAIYRAITDAWKAGSRAIDPVTLADSLSHTGQLDNAGGAPYLFDVVAAVPHAEHVRYYAGIVQKKSKLRRIINTGRQIVSEAYSSTADPEELLTRMEQNGLDIRESTTPSDFVSMDAAVDSLEERESNPAAIHATGLIDIDRQLNGGFADGQMVILGGRPGSGKSILAAQIVATFAARNEPGILVSLEMQRAEIAERLSKTIDRQRLRQLPIQIVDRAGTLSRIASMIRLAHRRDGIRLAAVDYLQLVEGDNRSSNREREVAEVSRTLKRLAMELNIPVIAACQLNRAAEQEKRRPRLSDLRESGAIEQDADIVGLLHRLDEGSEFIVAKQRNGATGLVNLAFRPDVFRFDNAAIYSGSL